jgi:glycosyltransferase involved in cell wall biosynthesis
MTPTEAARPIRILELRSVRGTGGGPEKTILLGATRTDASQYAVTVCYLRDSRDEVFHIDQRARDVPIDYVEIRERHSFDPSIWSPLRALVKSRQIDIVHAHDYKTDLLALLLGCVEPIVPLSTAHGWAGHSWKEEAIYYPADRRLLARFPQAIAVSSDIRETIVRHGGDRTRIHVLPNGVDPARFCPDAGRAAGARRDLGVSGEDLVVGSVGRLEAEKNYEMLVRAVGRLSTQLPQVHLFIAGDGSKRDDLLAIARETGLGDRCHFLGHLADPTSLYHALDVFVMPSDNEGSPNAVLEAMAMAVPVVATSVGGVSDLVRDGQDGLLVARRDLEGLTGAIGALLADRARARSMGRYARLRVERELSFENRMRRVEAIYDMLVERYQGVRQGLKWWRTGRA